MCLSTSHHHPLSIQAWTDPSAKKLRRDMANRVLGICKAQGRGGLAVRLLQLGARLAPKVREGIPWPGPGPYWAAMEAVRRSALACSVGMVCYAWNKHHDFFSAASAAYSCKICCRVNAEIKLFGSPGGDRLNGTLLVFDVIPLPPAPPRLVDENMTNNI